MCIRDSAEGNWQSSRGAVQPQGEARPAWKILRVLGNLLDIEGFDYVDTEQVLAELKGHCDENLAANCLAVNGTAARQLSSGDLIRGGDTPLNAADPLVRRADALQQTRDAGSASIRLHSKDVERLGLAGSEQALVNQNGYQAKLPLEIDDSLPQGCAWISTGLAETAALGQPFGEVTVEKS